ncbi:dCTP deaminase [Halobellus rubicundus]|uniref:dCTP deaminase n=1 Tax=Halobellus rubicundus TaxID=2996466 RepID=A0ABD5MG69_9EURY
MSGLADAVDGIVHEPTQVSDSAVDLTVAEVYEVHGPGRVDFGGGELTEADVVPHSRTWRDEGDEYQWWHLEAGTYLLEYNESLAGESLSDEALLQPRTEILERGASHPSLRVDTLSRIPLTVGGAGIRLKENARVSTLSEV